MIRMNFLVAIVFAVVIAVICGPSRSFDSPLDDYDYYDYNYNDYEYDYNDYDLDSSPEDEEGAYVDGDYLDEEGVDVKLPDWMDGDYLDLDKLPMDKVSLLNSAKNLTELAALFGVTKEQQDRSQMEFEEELNVPSVRFGVNSGNEIVTDAEVAHCKPALEVVNLEVPPKTIYIPQCVRLQRCGGCCTSKLQSCQPTRTENITLKVMKVDKKKKKKKKLQRTRKRRVARAQYDMVNQINHVECSCQCRIQEHHCNMNIQDYKASECSCVCKNMGEKAKCVKKSTHKWNRKTCSCKCIKTKVCSTGEKFSQETCSCVRKISPSRGKKSSSYQLVECNPTCGNGGTCSSLNTCTCTREWTGPSCQKRCDCIPLKSCEPLSHLLQDRTAQNFKSLMKFHCGHSKTGSQMVCCPPTEPPNPLPGYCGQPTIQDNFRIVGGKEVPLGKYTWMALLGYTDSNSNKVDYNCGGSVINERYVLTAAHCVTNLGSMKLHEVKLGEWDLSTEVDCEDRICLPAPLVYSPEKVTIHPEFNKRGNIIKRNRHGRKKKHNALSDDIAIIRLNATVNIDESSSIRAVCLPPADLDTRKVALNAKSFHRDFIVAGWGVTEHERKSEKLLEVEVPLKDDSICNTTYRGLTVSGQLCAGGRHGQDSCNADSGGPLLLPGPLGPPYLQVGVVSYGSKRGCGMANIPGVYTEVSKYIDWIKQNLED